MESNRNPNNRNNLTDKKSNMAWIILSVVVLLIILLLVYTEYNSRPAPIDTMSERSAVSNTNTTIPGPAGTNNNSATNTDNFQAAPVNTGNSANP